MTTTERAEASAVSLRGSLTGPSSISLTGWLGTLVPSTVLVLVQEAETPYPSLALVFASALLQFAADGALAGLALAIQRAFPRLDRLLLRLLLWTAVGTSRGLIGGIWAASFAGVSPDFGFRIAFWLFVTWLWMPTLGYTLARLDLRRRLLGRRDEERRALAAATAHADARHDDLRARLLDAVRAGVAPVVEEVRVRLVRLGGALEPSVTREIGARITGILDETDRIVRGVDRPASGGITTGPARAPWWAAIAVSQQRPFLTAGVMALGMATLLLPQVLRVGGVADALTVAAGIAASVAVVLLAALAERGIRLRSVRAQFLAFAARVVAAGAAGATTILALGGLDHVDLVLAAVMLPIVAGLAAAVVPTIVGINAANDALQGELRALREERRRLEGSSDADEERVRAQVAELLHGPIQGRLSACAMALSFHAAAESPPDPGRTAFIMTSVLEHLDAVTRDLEALTDARGEGDDGPGRGGDPAEGRG